MKRLFRIFWLAACALCLAVPAFAAEPLELQNRRPAQQGQAGQQGGAVQQGVPQTIQPTPPVTITPQAPSVQQPSQPTIIVPVVPVPVAPETALPEPLSPTQEPPVIVVPALPATPEPEQPEVKPESPQGPLTPGAFLPSTPEKKPEPKAEAKPKKQEPPKKAEPPKKEEPKQTPPPTPPPTPEPVPQAKAEDPRKGDPLKIPEEAKESGDLSFLEGCWVGTRPEYHTKRTVTERFCFGKDGVGKRYIIDPAYAGQCVGATRAELNQGGVLRMQSDRMFCQSGDNWGASEMTCQGEGEHTPCTWVFHDVGGARQSYSIRFVRE